MLLPSNHLWDGNTTPCGVWEIISSHPHITPPLFFQHPPLHPLRHIFSCCLESGTTEEEFHSSQRCGLVSVEGWQCWVGGTDPLWACMSVVRHGGHWDVIISMSAEVLKLLLNFFRQDKTTEKICIFCSTSLSTRMYLLTVVTLPTIQYLKNKGNYGLAETS